MDRITTECLLKVVLYLSRVISNPYWKMNFKNLILSLDSFQTVKLNLTSESLEDPAGHVEKKKKLKELESALQMVCG